MKYAHILAAIQSNIWAIAPEKLEAILGVVSTHQRGVTVNTEQWEALAAARSSRIGNQQGIAILGLHGTLAPRMGMMTASGGTSLDQFKAAYDQAMADPNVGAIVADVDSPGGMVYMTPELASHIRASRGIKPTYAVANCEACSAAYWLGTAFGKLYASPSAQVGSHGVVSVHVDQTQADAQDGLKYEFISAGENKARDNPHVALEDGVRADRQSTVDHYFGMFTKDLAANRGVSQKHVLENFGQGKVFVAPEALQRGMIDGIATLPEVIAMAQQKIASRQQMQRRRESLAAN